MTIHCSDHCDGAVPPILDQYGHEESISGIYLILRGSLGGVLVALPPQGNALVAQSRAHDMNVEKVAQTPPRRPLMTK